MTVANEEVGRMTETAKDAKKQNGGWLEEIKADSAVRAAQGSSPQQNKHERHDREPNQAKQARSLTKFQMANEAALQKLQEELTRKRMEALAQRLGLSPEEVHIEVRRSASGRCFGLAKFIVNIGYGVREATATEYKANNGERERQQVDRSHFGKSANTAADILASMESLKPSSIIAWSNERLAFLDVISEGIGASIRVCAKPLQMDADTPKEARGRTNE